MQKIFSNKQNLFYKSVLILIGILIFAQLQFDVLNQYFNLDLESTSFEKSAQDFITLFLGITVEAFPFVVFGTLVSVIVAMDILPNLHSIIVLVHKKQFPPLLGEGKGGVSPSFNDSTLKKGSNNAKPFVPLLSIIFLPYILISTALINFDGRLDRFRIYNHFKISIIGFFMPVCECGNVPVARRLLAKGFSVSQATTFLLAAPIINPITLFSTWKAFEPDSTLLITRLLGALIISNLIGLILSVKKNQSEFLTKQFQEYCEHTHDHNHINKLEEATQIFKDEFITVMKMLVTGALLAATMQSFIPREIITDIGSNMFLSVIAMIIFAFVISICSNVDAFVVLYYANTFSTGSLLSFLLFGPMIDIKILNMLRTTFTVRFLFILTMLVTLMSILAGLMVNYFT